MTSFPHLNSSSTASAQQSTSSTLLSPQRQERSSSSQFLTPNSAAIVRESNTSGSSRRSRRTSSRERERGIGQYDLESQEQQQSSSSISNLSLNRRPDYKRTITTEEVDEEVRPLSMALESWAVLDQVMSSSYKDSSEGGRAFTSSRSFSGMSNTSDRSGGRRFSKQYSGTVDNERSPSQIQGVLPVRSSEVESSMQSGFSIREETEEAEDETEDDDEGTIHAESIFNSEVTPILLIPPIRRPWIELSKVQRNVIKCTLAYFLAELFTFVPILAELVSSPFEGTIKNAHVIASVAVYFNPGRSIGGMLEADLFMFLGAIYSLFLCIGSMSMTVILCRFGLDELAQLLVVTLWIGGGFALVAYVKVKVNKPTMTTACSLVALFSSVIITKSPAFHIGEYHFEPILQLLFISILGILISNIICFGIWRDDSTKVLQSDLDRTLASFETLLGLLTRTFLMDPDPPATRPSELLSAITSHAQSFTLLQSSLSLSKYEFFNSHIQRNSTRYDEVVQIMSKLAQGLTGMRSGCTFHRVDGSGEKEREKEAVRLLERFKSSVGDSLEDLSRTSRATLSKLRSSSLYARSNKLNSEVLTLEDLAILQLNLATSLAIFQSSHSKTIKELYQDTSSDSDPFSDFKSLGEQSLNETGLSDNLFRIYYFCFNYTIWVGDLAKLIEVFMKIRKCEDTIDINQTVAGSGGSIYSSLASIFSEPRGPFPVIVDRALTSHRVMSRLTLIGRLKHKIWTIGLTLKKPNIRFAMKTGAGASLLASMAFCSGSRSIWLEYRGEWSLISYMVVMSPTLGGTNFLALGRILGTAFGGGIAVLSYLLFRANPTILPIFGAFFSIPCFYVIITRPQYAPSARFVLLTFNLTCLYAFNLRESDVHILSIAYHRSLAVSFGVLFALVITSYIWPFEARRELRKSLSHYFLNSAHLYERIVSSYSRPASTKINTTDNERTPLLPNKVKEIDDLLAMEIHLQLSLLQISSLLEATQNEPRLKGPFPIQPYRTALVSCQNLLDLLTSMRTVTSKDAWFSQIRKEFVEPVNLERREMVGNVILFFSILASALSLKTPLPAFLPPAGKARERLVQRLLQLPVVQNRVVRGEGSEGLLYLAYSVAMSDVIHELEVLGKIFQSLFGIIGGIGSLEEFDLLFVGSDDIEV